MNGLDLIILGVLAVGMLIGLRSGLIKQVASLAGLVLAFALGLQFMHPVGNMAVDSLRVSEALAPLLGFVLVFLAVQIAVVAVVKLVEAIIGALKLSAVNRALGGAMGGVKAALVLSVVFLVLGNLGIPDASARSTSSLYAPVSSVVPEAWEFVTGEFPAVKDVPERIGVPVPGVGAGAGSDTLSLDPTEAPDTSSSSDEDDERPR
jgi:membrane protein required for colicin V production